MSSSYPFGVAPKDPFDPALCPACRSAVGPRLHLCGKCFAAYDLPAARGQILTAADAKQARDAQLALGAVGLLGAGAVYLLTSTLAAMLPFLALVGWGLFAWTVFARATRAVSGISAALWLAVGLVALALTPLLLGVAPDRFYLLGPLGLAAMCGFLALLSARGVIVGQRLLRLHVVDRPAVLPDSYR